MNMVDAIPLILTIGIFTWEQTSMKMAKEVFWERVFKLLSSSTKFNS